jgi:hypothetical protein
MKTAAAILLLAAAATSAQSVKSLYKTIKLNPFDVAVSCVANGEQPTVTRYNRLIVVSCGR